MTTCFISGHVDITTEQWNQYYKDKIDEAIEKHSNFVVGDAKGADKMSIQYLINKNYPTHKVTIYHLHKKPRVKSKFQTKGGYNTYDERDSDMTFNSDEDIAWLRPEEETKILYGEKYYPRISGTQKNLERRQKKD